MGDLIEFTTWPRHQHIFYKVTGSAVAFSIKGDRYAAVGLAKRPSEKCNYWVVIGQNQCWIEQAQSHTNNVKHIPNILSGNAFSDFWLSWHRGQLQFGRSTDKVPLLRETLPSLCAKPEILDYKFITFTVYADRGAMQWRLFLPPKLEKPLLKKVTGSEMQWIAADEQLPKGATVGGYEKELLYIIRATHQGSLTPGKFVPSQGLGFVSWGGEMHEKNKFEVLCGYNSIWVPTNTNRIPIGAVEGGYSEDHYETLYVGRAIEDGHLIPGKVQPSHGVCYIPYNEKEVAKKEFEILVNPQIEMQSPIRYIVSCTEMVGTVAEIEED